MKIVKIEKSIWLLGFLKKNEQNIALQSWFLFFLKLTYYSPIVIFTTKE